MIRIDVGALGARWVKVVREGSNRLKTLKEHVLVGVGVLAPLGLSLVFENRMQSMCYRGGNALFGLHFPLHQAPGPYCRRGLGRSPGSAISETNNCVDMH